VSERASENSNDVCTTEGQGKKKSETFHSGPSIMALLYEHCSDLKRRSTSTSNFPESLRYEY
jgi:hypothetical protein